MSVKSDNTIFSNISNKFILILFTCLIVFGNLNCSPLENDDDPNSNDNKEDEIEVEVDGDEFILRNNSISLEFRKISNKLKLANLTSGEHVWHKSDLYSKEPLWYLKIFSPTSNTFYEVNSEEVSLKKVTKKSNNKNDHFIFLWEFTKSGAITQVYATVSLNNSTGLSEWDIEVDLPDKWEVTEINYPMVNIAKDAGMNLITSSNWGVDYYIDYITNYKFSLIYPSSAATVQLMCLNNNKRSLYFATHDKDANVKRFGADISTKKVVLSIETVPSQGWSKQEKFSLPWTAQIGVHNNGWESAVLEWYRPFALTTEWGKKSLSSKNIPQWLLDTDLWLHGGNASSSEYNALESTLNYFGDDTRYHWYYWMNHTFDTMYPEYLPAQQNYDKIVDLIHERGTKVMPYTNGRLWDPNTSIYKNRNGRHEVALDQNQNPYIEYRPNNVACPSSSAWSDIIFDFTHEILNGAIKNDALYFDQVASAGPKYCYNKNHDHEGGGGDYWHYSYRDIFTRINNSISADHATATEQNAECFTDLFDLFLMGNTPRSNHWLPAPLFPLIYSDRVLTYGFYLTNPVDANFFRTKNALTLLWGAQLNGGRAIVYTWGGWGENATYLKGLKTFRSKHHDLFVGGRFMGVYIPTGENPDLMVEGWDRPSKAVQGARWISTRGGEAVILVNTDTVSHDIILPDGKSRTLLAGECYRHNI